VTKLVIDEAAWSIPRGPVRCSVARGVCEEL
jgi:hypothetical protein